MGYKKKLLGALVGSQNEKSNEDRLSPNKCNGRYTG